MGIQDIITITIIIITKGIYQVYSYDGSATKTF
jgi:hypothetical protein